MPRVCSMNNIIPVQSFLHRQQLRRCPMRLTHYYDVHDPSCRERWLPAPAAGECTTSSLR